MILLDARPQLARQLPSEGPILLWRDGRAGRDGLLLLVEVCPFPGCPLRHVDVMAYRTDDSLVAVEVDGSDVRTRHQHSAAAPPRLVLLAAVDLDAGRVDCADDRADGAALAWLREELDGELLAAMRTRFLRERRAFDAPYVRGLPRVRRNDPCPCGSGRKFKVCCLM
jgi:hypothetical protein